jgi:hypothetical protein
MRFISNTHNPKDKYARRYVVRSFHEPPEQAWQHHLEWLDGKIIGRPQATETYTVEQLEAMDLVGVYTGDLT